MSEAITRLLQDSGIQSLFAHVPTRFQDQLKNEVADIAATSDQRLLASKLREYENRAFNAHPSDGVTELGGLLRIAAQARLNELATLPTYAADAGSVLSSGQDTTPEQWGLLQDGMVAQLREQKSMGYDVDHKIQHIERVRQYQSELDTWQANDGNPATRPTAPTTILPATDNTVADSGSGDSGADDLTVILG